MVAIKASSSNSKASEGCSRFLSKLFKFNLIIVSFLLYLLIVPLFVLLMSPLYLYRFLVILLAKMFKPDLIGMVCTRDGVVGLDDVTQKCKCMLNLLVVYSGEPDIQIIREVFQRKVMDIKSPSGGYSYEKFKYYYQSWLGFAFWKQEDDFKLENHIRFCEETEALGRNHTTTEEEFLRILGPMSTRPFAPKMSPWELLIIRNYISTPGKLHMDHLPTVDMKLEVNKSDKINHERRWAMMLRVHHSMSDGYSLMKMLLNNLSGEPMNKIPQPPVQKLSWISQFLIYVGIVMLSPYYHLRVFVLEVDRNFWHIRANKLTRDWYTTMSEKISLRKLKEIATGNGVSITAVLVGGFSGAVRKYLIESGHENKIPDVMRGFLSLPWKGHPMDSLVNHWTVGTTVIPVGMDCARKRLKAAEKSIRLLRRSPVLFTNFGTIPLLLGPPSWLTDIWAANWMTTMNISNFPGPNYLVKSFENYYAQDCTFWIPLTRGSASMGVAFLSYNGGIRVTLTMDKAIIPDEASSIRLNDLISEEIKSLYNLVLASSTDTIV